MLPLKPEVGGGGSQSLRFYSWFVSRMPADAEDPSCCGSVQDVAEPHRSFGSLDCYDCLGRCGALSGHGIRCFLIRSAKSAASSAFENIARAEVSLPPPFPL